MTLIVALVALVVDGGLDLRDKRDLQAISDIGALAGAAATGVLGSSSGFQCAVLQVTQSYAWQNVPGGHTPVSTNCTGPNVSGEYTWTESAAPYSITATYPYVNQLPAHAQDDPNVSVHVVVTHTQPTAFARAFGTDSVDIVAKSAAKAGSGSKLFPFALATRFLDLSGSGQASVFGAALIGQCDDNGRGDYNDNSHDGGLYANGGTSLVLGSSKDTAGAGGLYTSAQALLMTQAAPTCSTGSNGAVAYSGQAPSTVCFTEASCPSEYNGVFGFNSGPTGCAGAVLSPPTTSCQQTAYGDGSWQDTNCWTGGSGAAPILTTDSIFYTDTGLTSPPPPLTTNPCPVTTPAAAAGTREGSFPYTSWPGFPHYPAPSTLVNSNFTPGVASGCTVSPPTCGVLSATPLPNHVYTSNSATASTNYTFAPGWYVLQGTAASIALNGGSVTCTGTVPANGVPGCVFVFRSGASFDLKNSQLNCSTTSPVANSLPCSFEFSDTSRPTSSYFKVGGTDTYLGPISYTQSGNSGRFPIIWSASQNNPINGPNSGNAAVNLSNGTSHQFDVKGTIYANLGAVIYGQNASPVAGQTIADIIEIQGGSNSAGATAYSGSFAAPIPAAAVLFE